MANYYRGETVTDYFTILDDDSTVVTGAVVSLDVAIDPDGTTFPVTIAEVGNGVYSAQFSADKIGEYYYRLSTTTTDPPQYFEVSVDIEVPVSVSATGTSTSVGGNTLYDIIRYLAEEVGDFREAEATEDGSEDGTSFVSDIDLAGIPANGYAGSSFWIAAPEGPNFWLERRVQSLAETTQTLTLVRPMPARMYAGDVAWMTNLNSRGWPRRSYINATNAVLQSSFPKHLVEDSYTYSPVMDGETWYLSYPERLTHIYRIAAVTTDSWPYELEVPMSYQSTPGYPGWAVDATNSQLVLSGAWIGNVRGRSLKVYGYSREGILSGPADTTQLEMGYLIPEAARKLTLAKRDQKLLSTVSMLENQAMYREASGITQLEPGTIRIR